MKYYHGSRVKDLKKLTLDKSNDGYVWLAESYEFAVMYGANSIRFWKVNPKTGKLILREVAPNCFEKMYKGKQCYIYSADKVGDFEQADYLGRKSIKLKHDVNLNLEEYVPDAYDKIMALYKNGNIELWFWKDYSEEQKQNVIASLIKRFAPVMQDEYERFPDEYALLTELRPELKLENLTKKE